MSGYEASFRDFALPDAALRLARGDVGTELEGVIRRPHRSVGFPPALVPMYSVDYPWLVGFWVDPFGARATTIVEVVPENGYRAREEFRSFEQHAFWLVVHLIVLREDVEAGRRLAAELGVQDFDGALNLADTVGDDVSAFLSHPLFEEDPPYACDRARYRGDWPHAGRELTPIVLRHVSGLELDEAQLATVSKRPDAPAWLRTHVQPEVFDRLMADGDLEGAWRSLNSPGWLFEEARAGLDRLTLVANRPALTALASAWGTERHETFGGYGRTDRTTWWGLKP